MDGAGTLAAVGRLLLFAGAIVLAGAAAAGWLLQPGPEGDASAPPDATKAAQRRLALAGALSLAAAPPVLLGAQGWALAFGPAELLGLVMDTAWGRGWLLLALAAESGAVELGRLATRLRATDPASGPRATAPRAGTRDGPPATPDGAAAPPLVMVRARLSVLTVAVAGAMSGIGHAAADGEWPVAARLLDGTHVLATGAWLGGLLWTAAVAMAPPGPRPATTPRGPAAPPHPLWPRFSRLAVGAAPLAVFTGAASAVRLLRDASFDAVTASAYGRWLLLKAILGVSLVCLGARQRRRLLAARAPAGVLVRLETGVAALVMALTAVLTGLAPPGE